MEGDSAHSGQAIHFNVLTCLSTWWRLISPTTQGQKQDQDVKKCYLLHRIYSVIA